MGYGRPVCEFDSTDRNKVVILGGGPIGSDRASKFDYCCVHAAYALKDAGFEIVMVNCNLRDRQHGLRHVGPPVFRAATAEDVVALVRREQMKPPSYSAASSNMADRRR